MGCDIHAVIEVKDYAGEPWRAWAIDVDIDRRYHLFALMADVRNYAGERPVSPPRGVPSDCDPATREFLSAAGDHSASWLTLAEMQEVKVRLAASGDFENRSLNAVVAAMAALEESRLVFNFDN